MRAKYGLTVTNLGNFRPRGGKMDLCGRETYHRHMLTPEEVAHYHNTGQVTPRFRLGDEVVSDIRERMEAFFSRLTSTSTPDLPPA